MHCLISFAQRAWQNRYCSYPLLKMGKLRFEAQVQASNPWMIHNSSSWHHDTMCLTSKRFYHRLDSFLVSHSQGSSFQGTVNENRLSLLTWLRRSWCVWGLLPNGLWKGVRSWANICVSNSSSLLKTAWKLLSSEFECLCFPLTQQFPWILYFIYLRRVGVEDG